MRKWQRQRRLCSFCPNPASTIDHVVPLARGGTNYEGNLVPCCKRCNSSKAGWFISEWRHGLKPKQIVDSVTWEVTFTRKAESKRLRWADPEPIKVCPTCFGMHSGRIYCSSECRTEALRTKARNDYRLRVGIPIDAPLSNRGRPRVA